MQAVHLCCSSSLSAAATPSSKFKRMMHRLMTQTQKGMVPHQSYPAWSAQNAFELDNMQATIRWLLAGSHKIVLVAEKTWANTCYPRNQARAAKDPRQSSMKGPRQAATAKSKNTGILLINSNVIQPMPADAGSAPATQGPECSSRCQPLKHIRRGHRPQASWGLTQYPLSSGSSCKLAQITASISSWLLSELCSSSTCTCSHNHHK